MATQPSTRTLDQICRDLDPDYAKDKVQPYWLFFSNGRNFKRPADPYK